MNEKAQPEKMPLLSMDIAAEKREELKRCLGQAFPEIFTERSVDFDQLKRALGEWVDPGKERYGLNWPGKANCMKIIQQPSIATLKPAREESLKFDETGNIFIEGDNLEVLKLLQKAYFGKVKIIYIDPPYNTGNEFIYPDKYAETLETYLAYTNQIDASGKKFSTNTEAAGRYHSRWLNMMHPRLYVASSMLREDGVIAISINDAELENLLLLCNEIFGEENFIASLVWEKGRKNDAKLVSVGHEYVLLYAKNKPYLSDNGVVWREAKPGAEEIYKEYLRLRHEFGNDNSSVEVGIKAFYESLPKGHPSKKHSRYSRVDDNGIWRDDNMSWPGGGGPAYDVIHPVTGKPCAVPEGGWRYSTPEKMQEMILAGKVVFRENETEPPIRKTYLVRGDGPEEDNGDEEGDIGIQVAGSYFYRSALQASNELASLMGKRVFDNPKDHQVLSRWFSYMGSKDKDDIILDFFAGSGTTAQAVIELNKADGGSRNYILVQLPEPCEQSSAAFKAGYKTIADIGRERIRRVAKKIAEERHHGQLDLDEDKNLDLGFKALKLDRSNFDVWDGEAATRGDLGAQIEMHVDHLSNASTAEDILYELLLKTGFPLTTKIQTVEMAGTSVFSIEGGALLICLEKEVTAELIDALAEASPLQVICLDEAFKGNDQLKANAVQTFKARAQAEESEIVFKTV